MKRTQNIYIKITLVLATLLIIAAVILLPAFDSSKSNGISMRFNDGWMIESSDGSLAPFTDFGKKINSSFIVLHHDLSDFPDDMNAVGFYNYYSAVEVFVDGHLIYQYGSWEDLQNIFYLGNFYSMVDIHEGYESGKDLKLVFMSREAQTIYGFDAGSGPALEIGMIRSYITTLITPIIALFFLALSILLRNKDSGEAKLSKAHIWLLIFNLNISVWEIADSQLLTDIGFAAGKVCLLSFESYMVLPVTLMMFMYYTCKKYHKFNRILSVVILVNFLVLNLLHFCGIFSFLQTFFTAHILMALSLVTALIQVISEFMRNKNQPTIFLLVGYSLFFLCACVQYGAYFINSAESNSNILQIGTAVFIVLQIGNILNSVNRRIKSASIQLEKRNKLLEKTFGRFIPDEMLSSILDDPEDVNFSGDMRELTVLQSDIRGFSELLPQMSPSDAIVMLNHYLETMTIAIKRHGGTVMAFIGDGIMATFGSKEFDDNHANKAIFAALEMQNLMEDVHEWNKAHGFPIFEMGIGIHTGTSFVGYIGSNEQMKYDAIGSNVNLSSRIESYSTGGQILISEECKKASTLRLNIDANYSVLPKGASTEIKLYSVGGIGSPYNIDCKFRIDLPSTLPEPIEIEFSTIENKHCGTEIYSGRITAMSKTYATLETLCPLMLFDNIRITSKGTVSCKVVSKSVNGFLLRFTSIPKIVEEWKSNTKLLTGDTDGK